MNFKYLPFYKLHDWILKEFGASTDAALLSIIYSFEENGIECKLSYSAFADILKVSRPNAIARIKKLIESGYLIAAVDRTKTNVYKVNRDAFNNDISTSNENDINQISTSNENDTSTSIENDTSYSMTSNENDTSTSIENITQIENEKEKSSIEKKKREAAAPSSSSASDEISVLMKEFTPEQIIRHGFDFSQAKQSAEQYIGKLNNSKYKPLLHTVIGWIRKDTGLTLRGVDEIRAELENEKLYLQKMQAASHVNDPASPEFNPEEPF